MSLLNQLAQKGLIKDKEKIASLEYQIKESGKREEDVILKEKLVSETILYGLKSENLNVPLREITADQVTLDILGLIPEETAKHYQMIPLSKEDEVLEVGLVYPDDLKAQEALKFLARQGNFAYKVSLITPTTLNLLLKQYRDLKKEVGLALEELETELQTETVKAKTSSEEFERMAEEAPITKIVAVILRHAVDGGASDIHVEPTRERLQVRFRQLGVLHPSIFLPLRVHPAVITRIKIISGLKIDETRIPQDGRFSTKVNDKIIDFRVSTFPTTMGEKVAIRVLDPTAGLKGFEQLGLDGRNLAAIKDAISKPYGLILATGPTGSGKTTTLYAVLQLLNQEGVNIVTLEDPAEYFIDNINQSQIKPDIGYDFASGLRQILRQDPDIIMIGEIRDEETANMVTHAALTGHIVLSTLHTNNALGVVSRMIDMGIKPYLIPSSLQLAIAQRLVRRLCDGCKIKIEPEQKIKDFLMEEIKHLPPDILATLKINKPLTIYAHNPEGCSKCNRTGYSGRVGVFEVLSMTPSLASTILKDPSEGAIKKEAELQGMVTMKQDGVVKILKGVTTAEEVLRVTEEK